MLENIKAAIFDMDGTLIDSMWVWGKIDMEYLTNRGISLPSDLREKIEHLGFLDVAKYFKERFQLPHTIDEITAEWSKMAYTEYEKNVKLKPGAADFLKMLKDKGIKIGLATSNSMELLEVVLKKNNIYDYFDNITTTDEVSRGKDFPDVYLLCAKRLGIEPSDCVVFEDILPAVRGAKAAGMKVVAVYDEYSAPQRDEILNLADSFIEHYDELRQAI